jgi:hypothetical protein
MMSVEVAKSAQQFNKANNIRRAEAMGGEFYLNPDWEEILDLIGDGLEAVRLVTCGDWAANPKIAARVIAFLDTHRQFYVGLSKDRWHKNEHVDEAEKMLKDAGIVYHLPEPDEIKEETIVPVGRGELMYRFYSSFGTYCTKPDRRYSFLVDEAGTVYKCGFGVWDYAEIQDYVEGGFGKRFKEFNTKFYSIFITSCAVCQRSEHRVKAKEKREKKNGDAKVCA